MNFRVIKTSLALTVAALFAANALAQKDSAGATQWNFDEYRKTYPEITDSSYQETGASGFTVGWDKVQPKYGVHAKGALSTRAMPTTPHLQKPWDCARPSSIRHSRSRIRPARLGWNLSLRMISLSG